MPRMMKLVLIGLVVGSIPFVLLAWMMHSDPDLESHAGVESTHTATPDPETHAKSLCMDALKDAAQYPSSVSFSIFTDPPVALRRNDGVYQIKVNFTAKNGYGNEVPLAGHCQVKNGSVINFEAGPR